MEILQRALRDRGSRLTPQRLAIYEYLKDVKTHPAAETIYTNLKDRYPSLSLNTVYQTLQVLAETGLAQKLPVEGRVARYDGNAASHAHLVCLQCDRIWDIDADTQPAVAEIDRQVEKKGFKVVRDQVQVYGYCTDCQAGSEREPKEEGPRNG
ncbi:MAG: transcriptional repressor [Dehalococcoidales bacterium]|nr:transcriptional repressor [Dehalococcoidales bacterium]